MSRQPLKLSIAARTFRAMGPFLEWHVPRIVKLAHSPLRELGVVIAHDPLVRRLHQQYFDDPSLTDVITFPLEVDGRGRALSGELYLCLSVARRQAALRHIPVQHELLLYAVHGILHLSGHDDQTPRKFAAMHKEEDRILEAMGLGPVFGLPELGTRHKPRVTRASRSERTIARKRAR
jgi:rRNA maturation RNase YbeY